MKRIGGFGRAAHRDGLPVRVCFPEACAKVISVKTACQTFLTVSKKYLKRRRCGAWGVLAVRVFGDAPAAASRCIGRCKTGDDESSSPSPARWCFQPSFHS
ncbi:hypothetical protein [Burkholderia sp. RF4-BP95]|uniref:hypothetical protein n=1 Tax=Burkholderia sp. RF4-BP95 TaxID=1637845 RepID=UPI000AE1281F|nr:hypothetical protein [Burkholderia sp. RF4-BP95]